MAKQIEKAERLKEKCYRCKNVTILNDVHINDSKDTCRVYWEFCDSCIHELELCIEIFCSKVQQ